MGASFLRCGVVLGLLILVGCGAGADEQRASSEAAEAQRKGGKKSDLSFVPVTYRDEDRVVLPVTFPDGTSAELVYPPELEIAALGVSPYSSGRLRGKSPTPDRGDSVARDFVIRYGDLDEVLEVRNEGTPPELLVAYEGADGQAVGLWHFGSNDTAHYLGFQFGHWAVLVYDYVAAGAMTDAERASWSANFSGRETDDGFLLLAGSGPLRLAAAGEHAGPELTFSAPEPMRALLLFPGECRPHRDQAMLVDGKLVSWGRGGFASWCLSDTMRIHAEGSREFIGERIRGLEVRKVLLAKE
jgi:hypothetical protein